MEQPYLTQRATETKPAAYFFTYFKNVKLLSSILLPFVPQPIYLDRCSSQAFRGVSSVSSENIRFITT